MTLLLVTLAVGVALSLAGVAMTRSAPPPAPTVAGLPAQTGAVKTFADFLDEAQVRAMTRAQWATIARENAVVVLNSWDFRLIPVLKRANPAVQVWVYKDLSGVRSDDCSTRNGNCGACGGGVTDGSFLSSGMGYCWVKRHHPGWLVGAIGSGQPFEFRGYPQIWETDYGNSGYQRQWASNVISDVRGHGWDGVQVDNALTIPNAYGIAAKYRTGPAVQAATYSALRTVGGAFHHADVRLVVNVGYATSYPELWQRWLGPVDGLEQEFYLSYSAHTNAVGTLWDQYENEVSSCAAEQKVCWFHSGSYAGAVTPRSGMYAVASFLLATDGRQLLSLGDLSSVPLPQQLRLGRAEGAMTLVGRVWRRSFDGGVVAVNPTGDGSETRLGGSYLGTAGRPVSRILLGPASGVALRAAAGATVGH
jgi:hypothetical protein